MNVELQLGTIILSVHYYLSMELKQLQCAGHIFKLNMAVSTFLSPATALTARGPKVPHSCLQEQEGESHRPPKPSQLTKKTLVDHFESDNIDSDFYLPSYLAVNRYIFIWNIIKEILFGQSLNNKSVPNF